MQVYVSTETGDVRRPRRELRSFRKVFLEAGATVDVELELGHRSFAYWNVELNQWVVPAGEYRIQLGCNASQVIDERIVDLPGDDVVPPVTIDSPLAKWLEHPVHGET